MQMQMQVQIPQPQPLPRNKPKHTLVFGVLTAFGDFPRESQEHRGNQEALTLTHFQKQSVLTFPTRARNKGNSLISLWIINSPHSAEMTQWTGSWLSESTVSSRTAHRLAGWCRVTAASGRNTISSLYARCYIRINLVKISGKSLINTCGVFVLFSVLLIINRPVLRWAEGTRIQD